jgi:hypothetical protein
MYTKSFTSNERAFRAYISGNKEAINLIIANFQFFIRSRAGLLASINDKSGVDYFDLELVGQSALITAVRTFRGDATPFAPYATVVINNAMSNYIKQQNNPTNSLSRFGLSLDSNLYEDNDTFLISDSVAKTRADNDLGIYTPAKIGFFEDLLPISLTPLEISLIKGKIAGYTYQEMQRIFKIPKRKLDATIASIKEKWRALLF